MKKSILKKIEQLHKIRDKEEKLLEEIRLDLLTFLGIDPHSQEAYDVGLDIQNRHDGDGICVCYSTVVTPINQMYQEKNKGKGLNFDMMERDGI